MARCPGCLQRRSLGRLGLCAARVRRARNARQARRAPTKRPMEVLEDVLHLALSPSGCKARYKTLRSAHLAEAKTCALNITSAADVAELHRSLALDGCTLLDPCSGSGGIFAALRKLHARCRVNREEEVHMRFRSAPPATCPSTPEQETRARGARDVGGTA
jgi:hypothetical protein